ncbi:uncharacterized protein LOC136061880 [Quercus suber]|uniref:uncharacterized protein LOC136061880 n=1 Tax=Quercus suber TaxID=58331 RepID=UPI0032E036B4
MQREIDDLKRKLHHAQRKRSEPSLDLPSDDESDDDYRQRSMTPPSEAFSREDERYQRHRRGSPAPKGLGSDAMSRALDRLSRSPFTRRIDEAELPRRFQHPTFTVYNGKMDPVEHVSQFNQRMAVHSKNEALMCKVFPSNLGPVAMRWFNGLRTNSVDSYRQLTQAFGSRFVTNSRLPRPMSALLSLTMRDDETLKAYSDKYWEIYNELDGKYDDVAINTFKNGLSMGHDLRKSLTSKPTTSVRQLMDRIDKYKRVEEDWLQGKGKEKAIPQERRDSRSDRYNNTRSRRDFIGQSGVTNAQAVGAVFQEPVHRVLEKIKNEPYFKWPNKMSGDPEKCNQDRYCQYHQDHRHTTEDCRNLWNYLDQLVREGRLKHLLHHFSSQQGQTYQESRRDTGMGQPVGTINVILVALGRTGMRPSRVLSVAQVATGES